MIGAVVILTFAILLGIGGQLLLKLSTTGTHAALFGLGFVNAPFLGAAVLYFVSLICYTISLRSVPLHIAFPSVSVSYVAVAWLSSMFWNTPFGGYEMIAFLLILLGLCLLVASQARVI